MKSVTIDEINAGQRIEKFVRNYLKQAPLGYIYKAFRKKDIKVNGHWVKKDYILSLNDLVTIYVTDKQLLDFKKPRPVEKKPFPYPIVYEDEFVLLVNKPKGVLVYGDKKGNRQTLGNAVLDYLYLKGEYDPESSFTPSPAHRLDRNTAGLVLYGKKDTSLKALTDLFKERNKITKTYTALVLGDLKGKGSIEAPLIKDKHNGRVYVGKIAEGAKQAKTEYKVIKRYGSHSLVELTLLTGRTHQLRVHLAHIGHPIVGDEKYGDKKDCQLFKKITGLDNQMLIANQISFGSLDYPLKGLSNKSFNIGIGEEITLAISKLALVEVK